MCPLIRFPEQCRVPQHTQSGKKKNLDHAALKAMVDEALQSVAFAEMLSAQLLEMKRKMDEVCGFARERA